MMPEFWSLSLFGVSEKKSTHNGVQLHWRCRLLGPSIWEVIFSLNAVWLSLGACSEEHWQILEFSLGFYNKFEWNYRLTEQCSNSLFLTNGFSLKHKVFWRQWFSQKTRHLKNFSLSRKVKICQLFLVYESFNNYSFHVAKKAHCIGLHVLCNNCLVKLAAKP